MHWKSIFFAKLTDQSSVQFAPDAFATRPKPFWQRYLPLFFENSFTPMSQSIHNQVRSLIEAADYRPQTKTDFARTLGRSLGRPAFMPAPAFAVRIALGEMADALLLSSQRVRPKVLEDAGYKFKTPTLAQAIQNALS